MTSAPIFSNLLVELITFTPSYSHNANHGDIVGVRAHASGVIGRRNDLPDEFPNLAQFHALKVNNPSLAQKHFPTAGELGIVAGHPVPRARCW